MGRFGPTAPLPLLRQQRRGPGRRLRPQGRPGGEGGGRCSAFWGKPCGSHFHHLVSLSEFGRRALQALCTELPVGNFGRHVCCGKSPLVSWIWALGNSPGPLARSSRSISSEGPKSSTLFWGSPPHVWCILLGCQNFDFLPSGFSTKPQVKLLAGADFATETVTESDSQLRTAALGNASLRCFGAARRTARARAGESRDMKGPWKALRTPKWGDG